MTPKEVKGPSNVQLDSKAEKTPLSIPAQCVVVSIRNDFALLAAHMQASRPPFSTVGWGS